jgi:CheY-like chemotaxis protein/two-component sensor histidine kinase
VTEDRPHRDPYVQTLEARIAKLAGDNARLASELATARGAKDDMLALLGHELRNPLAPIVAALDLIKLRSGGAVGRELAIIERHVERLRHLISDLLDVSRLSRGVVVLHKDAIALDEAVSSAIEASQDLLEARQHTTTIEVPHELRVDADRSRLVQVLTNLLVNAATYTPPGGAITIRAVPRGNAVAISVMDTGRGFSQETLPRLFQPFTRSSGAAETGLGLGLAIVKNLVELHGGNVTAVSAGVGQGTEILLSWPAAALLDPPPPKPCKGERARRRILVVDDNVDAAETLAEMLRLMGHDVVVAHDGAAALSSAASVRPHLALLDLGMPVMDGFELAQRLKTNPDLAGVSVVALTGFSSDRERERAKNAGFDHHLVKPLDPALLAKLLGED